MVLIPIPTKFMAGKPAPMRRGAFLLLLAAILLTLGVAFSFVHF